MPTEGERLATIEQVLLDLRGDIVEMQLEQTRTRERVHSLEGATSGLAQIQRERLIQQDNASRRVQIRLQVLTVAVAVAALGSPFVNYALGH